MRHLTFTLAVDGIPTKFNIRKVPKERRFYIVMFPNPKPICEYILNDQGEVEYYEGQYLSEKQSEQVSKLIKQYFGKSKAIVKVGEDNYEDYDDD